MNNPSKSLEMSAKLAKISAILSPVFAAVIAVGYFFALKFDFEYDIGHFARSSPLFITTAVAIALGIAVPAAAALATRKKASITRAPKADPALLLLSVVAVALTLVELGAGVFTMLVHSGTVGKLGVAACLTLPLLAVGLVTIAVPKYSGTALSQIALTGAIISVDLYILACYFNEQLPLNSPIRHMFMLAQLSLMLFLISEARLSFGITEHSGAPTARRALLPFCIFANNTAASVGLGFSAGALAHELLSGNDASLHPLCRVAMYAALGGVAMCRAFSLPRLLSEYNPSPIELPKEKNDSQTNKNNTDNNRKGDIYE